MYIFAPPSIFCCLYSAFTVVKTVLCVCLKFYTKTYCGSFCFCIRFKRLQVAEDSPKPIGRILYVACSQSSNCSTSFRRKKSRQLFVWHHDIPGFCGNADELQTKSDRADSHTQTTLNVCVTVRSGAVHPGV